DARAPSSSAYPPAPPCRPQRPPPEPLPAPPPPPPAPPPPRSAPPGCGALPRPADPPGRPGCLAHFLASGIECDVRAAEDDPLRPERHTRSHERPDRRVQHIAPGRRWRAVRPATPRPG